MWMIKNLTPYAAAGSWVQDKDANKLWLVVMKATFDILPDGRTRLADNQLPPLRSPLHYEGPGTSSIQSEADLLGSKRTSDIIVNGAVYAPGGRTVASADARITLGGIDKWLRIFGERIWERGALDGVRLSSPKPFSQMPIRYERAFGGWDQHSEDPQEHRFEPRNPIGRGFAIRESHCVGSLAPNVEYPGHLISVLERPATAGRVRSSGLPLVAAARACWFLR